MPGMTLEALIEEVKALTPEQQRQLRLTLDSQLSPSPAATEADFKRALLQAGLLSEVKPRSIDVEAHRNFQPIAVKGEPVSQTIIEERR